MQAPFTMCIPGPQAWRTLMNISLGVGSGARGTARADDAKTRAITQTVHLIMVFLLSSERQLHPFGIP